MRKICLLLAVLWVCLLAACGGDPGVTEPVPQTTAATVSPTTAPPVTVPPTTVPPTEPQPEHFTLTFVGDCTLGCNPDHYYAGLGFIKTIGDDYGFPFRNVMDYFQNDEMTFINLEGPLTDTGYPADKRHVFRGPTDYIRILTENSVEAVSLANNHTLDYGLTGYQSTLDTLNAAGVPYVERDNSTLITTKNGLTIGIYGAMYAYLDVKDMAAEMAALRQQGAELIIYAPHWGSEGSYRPTKEQEEVAKAAVEAGADIVWGSHPHVLQPIVELEGSIVCYSLGNFSFGGNIYPKDYDSALIQIEVIRDPDGTVRLGQLIIVPVNVSSDPSRNNFQPTPYAPGSPEHKRVMEKLDGTFAGPNLKIG